MPGANVLSDYLQVTVATMTANCKRAVRGMSTDLSKFSKGRIQEVEAKLKESQGHSKSSMPASRARGHVRAHLMDPEKMRYSKHQLAKVHKRRAFSILLLPLEEHMSKIYFNRYLHFGSDAGASPTLNTPHTHTPSPPTHAPNHP